MKFKFRWEKDKIVFDENSLLSLSKWNVENC